MYIHGWMDEDDERAIAEAHLQITVRRAFRDFAPRSLSHAVAELSLERRRRGRA